MNTQAHDNFRAPADTARFGLLTPHDLEVIGTVLRADPEEVTGVSALKKGMTNRSFLFSCRGEKYIMRVPGEGTGRLIDRRSEAAVYRLIQGRGLCEDVLYIDPDSGYKISRFIEGARTCDPMNGRETAACMDKLRSFHGLGLRADHEFDLFGHIDFYESLWDGRPSAYPDYRETKERVFRLKPFLDAHAGKKVLTHIDAVPDNFLFFQNGQGQEEIRLIDWEYAAMQDPHVDIAMFCIYAMYGREQADKLIDQYFIGGCPPLTRIKIYGYIAVCGLLWSNWCEYKRSLGVEFGAYSLAQYRYARDYCEIVRRELERLGEALP
ncbi:MAG: phosphotransferase family protein [Clostridiales bacterium]|nr:phosphotransferase family protein [Clostridiales bacterium]